MDAMDRFRLNSQTLYSVLVCGYHESAIKRSAITSQSKPIEVLLKFEEYVDMIVDQLEAESTGHSLKQQDKLLHSYARVVKLFNDRLRSAVNRGLSVKDTVNSINLLLEIQSDMEYENPHSTNWLDTLSRLYGWFLEDVIISQAYLVCNTPEYSKYPPYLLPTFGDNYMPLTLRNTFTLSLEGNKLQPTSIEVPLAKLAFDVENARISKVRGMLLDRNIGKTGESLQRTPGSITLLGDTTDILKGSRVSWESYKNSINIELTGRNYRPETRTQFNNKTKHLNSIHEHVMDLVALKYYNRVINTSNDRLILVGYDYFQPDSYNIGESDSF